jgi:2,5-diketo-D-gluconate reductase A
MERLKDRGAVRAIGTSNFTRKKMRELLSLAQDKPQVNQIEIHPFYTEDAYCSTLRGNRIQPEAWGPLNEGQRGIFQNALLSGIGSRYGKSAAQTALRWNIQKGNVIIPKSTKKEHMRENLDIFDFALTEAEMAAIDSLDRGRSEIIDFENPATERLLMKLKIHE